MNLELLATIDDYRDRNHPELRIPKFDVECSHCGALRLVTESKSICCSGGKVKLPLKNPMSEEIKLHIWGNESVKANIRAYNQALAFTSIRTEIDNAVLNSSGIYNYRICGELYHVYGGLSHHNEEDAKFAQIYLYDPDLQLRRRMCIFDGLDESVLQFFQKFLLERNPYVQLLQQVGHLGNDSENQYQVNIHNFGGVYGPSTATEVGSILLDGSEGANRDIILRSRDDKMHCINELHSSYDALQYPLLFPHGDIGWNDSIPISGHGIRQRVSMRQYYCFHLMMRRVNLNSNPLHLGGRLLQQFLVDMWSKVETNRLNYIAKNQQKLRCDRYRTIQDAVENGDCITGKRILPSSFTGGPRYMAGKYQDAMAVVRHSGKPHLFITFTCNPMWKEIQDNLLFGQSAPDRPDLVARVFKAKLEILIKHELPKIFGKIEAKFYSVEFQKRGLPHAHILLVLSNCQHSDLMENIVSAELPCEESQPHLFKLVLENMIHKPCHNMNTAPCKDSRGKCTKHYPKEYREISTQDENGYPLYRRRNNGRCAKKYYNGKEFTITNSNVVPYVPYLLETFNCHINVEICSSIYAVKYLFKYIYKGADRSVISVKNEHDEIQRYKAGRYISPVEAAYRLMGFDLHYQSHTVHRLPVHLPNQQIVQFEDEEDLQDVLDRSESTKLTEFFKLCSKHEQLKYIDVPKYFVWKKGTWVTRKRNSDKSISRIYAVSPMEGERFYLRMLLNIVVGPKSFEDVRTYRGIIHSTFKDAVVARGLLCNDDQYDKMLQEAASHEMPYALRHTFAAMLLFSEIADPDFLWLKFLPHLSEDLRRKYPSASLKTIEGMVAYKIDEVLKLSGTSFENFISRIDLVEEIDCDNNQDIIENMGNVERFTEEQLTIYHQVMDSIDGCSDKKLIFLEAPGGCGKTYLYNGLAAQLLSKNRQVVCVAASAIAASLLIGGNTAHAFFKIPLNASKNSTCNIGINTLLAQKIRETQCFIWDEAPMSDKYAIEAVDKTLRDLLRNNEPFGGKVFIFGGDFRQTLPVVAGGSRSEIIDACIKSSELWTNIHRLQLTVNLRTLNQVWNDNLLRIGNGSYPIVENNQIEIPRPCQIVMSVEDLIDKVYPGLFEQYENFILLNDSSASDQHLSRFLEDRVILTPTNARATEINQRIMDRIHGHAYIYSSADSVIDTDPTMFQPELLNKLQPSGMPPHLLRLKPNMPVILMRNLNKKAGLCNGVRLMILDLHPNHIKVRISNGKFKGDIHFLFRISCLSSDIRMPFQLKRVQFPIMPCFAMTINKSQGQTLKCVGLDLESPIFSHGQLYVALSRTSDPDQLYVFPGTEHTNAHNIVFDEALA